MTVLIPSTGSLTVCLYPATGLAIELVGTGFLQELKFFYIKSIALQHQTSNLIIPQTEKKSHYHMGWKARNYQNWSLVRVFASLEVGAIMPG
jgi:hypothetical protein